MIYTWGEKVSRVLFLLACIVILLMDLLVWRPG